MAEADAEPCYSGPIPDFAVSRESVCSPGCQAGERLVSTREDTVAKATPFTERTERIEHVGSTLEEKPRASRQATAGLACW